MGQAAPDNLATVLILGVLFLVALIALSVWASTIRRQRSGSRQEALFALGFTPLDPPPAALLDRIAALQPHRSQGQLTLRNVFECPVTGGHAYLFDGVDAESDGPSWLSSDTLAITSQVLQCPTLIVLPRPQSRGAMGSLAGDLLERAYTLASERGGLVRTSYPDDPEFEERFAVMGADAGAVQRFLTPQRRTALLVLPQDLVVAAHRDTLTLSAYAGPGAKETAIEQVQSRRELAETLLHAFAARGASGL